MTDQVPFEEESPRAPVGADGELRLDLDGFEGPIDVLLQLAREQKVDLTKISILALADQYLEFVRQARKLRLELAADYLVMAAWLAYLKSRLLLPEPDDDEEPSGAEMAAALKFQLQRLEAMQEAGQRLIRLPQLGSELFQRGAPETMPVVTTTVYQVSLYDLLKAYARNAVRAQAAAHLRIAPLNLFSVEDALQRLRGLLGATPGWQSLLTFLPTDLQDDLQRRSAVASTFAASLEMVRQGKLQMRQDGTFGPIYLRGVEQQTS
ncbi:MAG: segregation and condensation protein A [Kiloniellales bacterium]